MHCFHRSGDSQQRAAGNRDNRSVSEFYRSGGATRDVPLHRPGEEADRGFHDAGLEGFLLRLLALALEVVEVGLAEPAPQDLDVELDVLVPVGLQGPEHVRPDGVSFGATEAVVFPQVGQQAIRNLGLGVDGLRPPV